MKGLGSRDANSQETSKRELLGELPQTEQRQRKKEKADQRDKADQRERSRRESKQAWKLGSLQQSTGSRLAPTIGL